MEIKSKKIESGVLEVTATLAKDEWKAAQEKAFHKLAKNVSVPGFRPGKAPEHLLRERVSQASIFDEAASSVLNPTLVSIINQEKVEPFLRPDVKINKFSSDELELVYTIVCMPTCTLGEYKGLKVEHHEVKVTDEEVEAEVKKAFEANADLVAVEREAKEGDSLKIDFKGYTKNDEGKEVAFEGGEASNYTLVLGSHTFVPGFEEALVGIKTGEEKDIEVTFPTTYVKELAGKKARFHILCHEIKEKVIPEMDDEGAKDLNIKDVDSLASLKDYEKKTLEERKQKEEENRYLEALLKKVRDNATYEIARAVIDNEAKARLEQLKNQIQQNGLEYTQYLELTGKKEEEILADLAKEGEENIKSMLAMSEVAKVENLNVTPEDIEKEYERIAAQYEMKLEDVKKALKPQENQMASDLRGRRIIDKLKELNA